MTLETISLMKKIIPIILMGSIFFILIGIYFLQDKIKDGIKNMNNKVNKDFVIRKKNRYIQDFIPGKLSIWLDETYKYSRIYTMKYSSIINTSIKFFILAVFLSAILSITIGIFVKQLIWILISFPLIFTFIYLLLYILRSYQNRKVTKDVSTFLNLLGNYSTTNTEINSIFMQIAPQMHEPLSSVLIECVAESENKNQDQIQALENLKAKIENQKVREIISSLIITKKYAGSFSDTVNAFRGSVLAYIRRTNELRNLSIQNTISLLVVVSILIITIFILGSLLETSIIDILLHSPIGIIILTVAFSCILYFIKNILEVMN